LYFEEVKVTSNYQETSEHEAEEIAKTLRQVDTLLASEKLSDVYESDVQKLRGNVRKMLLNISTHIQTLSALEDDVIFKTDPSFANQRHRLINLIETAKIDFEFDIVPALEKLTKQVIANSKQEPPTQVDESKLPPPPAGESWTVQKVLDTAGQFVDQAAHAGTILTKAYTLAKALGLVLGIPVP
jgi:hypothetical protein